MKNQSYTFQFNKLKPSSEGYFQSLVDEEAAKEKHFIDSTHEEKGSEERMCAKTLFFLTQKKKIIKITHKALKKTKTKKKTQKDLPLACNCILLFELPPSAFKKKETSDSTKSALYSRTPILFFFLNRQFHSSPCAYWLPCLFLMLHEPFILLTLLISILPSLPFSKLTPS